MKTEGKNRWMIWAVVILAVMNVTTIITVLYQHKKAAKEVPVTETVLTMSENASVKYSGRYFRDELGLTMEQMNRFSEFNPQFRQKVRAINLSLSRKRQEMLSEMSATVCDTAKLDMLSDSIGYLHASLKKHTYNYYLDFRKICDEQQQEKLEKLFKEMFATDIQMGQYGKGGPNGRGRGRRPNN